ncbi:MAG: altronate dehydratase family protein [Desulfobacterales bacterium]|nr:altronate dehydratase family protein [Desulfobacterales bacterium]
MKQRVLKVHPADNVLVALQDLRKGETVQWRGQSHVTADAIGAKHKFFESEMPPGAAVIMYGVLVGTVRIPVPRGGLVTTDNVTHAASPFVYRPGNTAWTPPDVTRFAGRTFNGYHRSDGRVGTANYWLFIPTVFCENRNLEVIREALQRGLGYAGDGRYRSLVQRLIDAHARGDDAGPADLSLPDVTVKTVRPFKNVDGIKFLTHPGGCGGTRQDAALLGRLLAAYVDHPNVGGVTILSLGCQNLQVQDLLDAVHARNPRFDKPLLVFEHQQAGGTERLLASAIQRTFDGLVEIDRAERKPAPLNDPIVGVKCGGSDGFSGISANPAVGHCSDLLVALGGKVLLAEFPELCGAEQDLIDRTRDEAAARKFMRLMTAYSEAAQRAGSGFHMNPSPGNIKDGLITDAIKSAGAARKGGTSPVEDVLDYTEAAMRAGLNLVCTPGNDVEATTGQAASGATLILFTTGLGTPTGNAVCPVIKLSTNSELARRMADIIDIDTGPIVDGEKTIEQMGEEILEYCVRAASGEVTPKAVRLCQDDFIPWKQGVSL